MAAAMADKQEEQDESQPKSMAPRRSKPNDGKITAVDLKAATIRLPYYPEGAWGWVVIACASITHVITSGLQLSFGVFFTHLIKQPLARDKYIESVLIGSGCLATSLFVSPVVVSLCRKNSTRLTAIIGGLVATLACLFASFGSQFHQLALSYGILLGIGIGVVRESSNLMVGQYFKRKRAFVEIFIQASIGIGLLLMSSFLNWSFHYKHWRAGLQLVTCAVFATFVLSVFYRPASIYHPQRRAILHLKIQRRKIREKHPQQKRPPFFDLEPVKTRSLQIIMSSIAIFSFGFLSFLFNIPGTNIIEKYGFENTSFVLTSQIININVNFGLSFTTGVVVFGCLNVLGAGNCFMNRQYLCQLFMFLHSLILLIPVCFNANYYLSPLFICIHGIVTGSFFYIFKMFLFELVRAKTFGKVCSWVAFAQSIPILLGIPFTAYVNLNFQNYGFLFSSICCLLGSIILCLLSPSSNSIDAVRRPTCDQHLLSPSESNQFQLKNPSESASSDNVQDPHCCNCGKKFNINADLEKHQETVQNCNSGLSPKLLRQDSDYEDEDDEVWYKLQNAPEMGTYFSEDLCNYYLQNEQEELSGENDGLVKERILPVSEIEEDTLINRWADVSKISCEPTDKQALNSETFAKRTIETVTEETSNC